MSTALNVSATVPMINKANPVTSQLTGIIANNPIASTEPIALVANAYPIGAMSRCALKRVALNNESTKPNAKIGAGKNSLSMSTRTGAASSAMPKPDSDCKIAPKHTITKALTSIDVDNSNMKNQIIKVEWSLYRAKRMLGLISFPYLIESSFNEQI